jgi:F-type H+-transporting ATPase subunit b
MLQFPNVSMVLILAIFFATLWVLNRFLFRPVSAILDERETEAETAARSLSEAEEKFRAAAAKIETELSLSRREALKIREENRAEGRRLREQQVEAAKQETAGRLEAAAAELAADARRTREELPGKVSTIVSALVEKVLGRKAAA